MLKSLFTRFKNDERGVTAIEYGIIGVAIAAVLIIAMNTGGDAGTGIVGAIQGAFADMANSMTVSG